MLLHIPEVFTKDEVRTLRARLDAGPWADGNATSGHQSATAKVNRQLPEDSAVAREIGGLVLQALNANPMFVSAALPHTIFPPLFNAYEGGEHFGVHVDNAIRQRGDVRIRSDLSATLFLSEPEDYDGGELLIEEMYGAQSVKLPAGDLVLYPSKSLQGDTGNARPAGLQLFLATEPDPRRCRPRDPVPARRGHPAGQCGQGTEGCGGAGADRGLSQPDPALVGGLIDVASIAARLGHDLQAVCAQRILQRRMHAAGHAVQATADHDRGPAPDPGRDLRRMLRDQGLDIAAVTGVPREGPVQSA